MAKIVCTFSLFGLSLLFAANLRIEFPHSFLIGFCAIGCCVVTGIFALASACEWLGTLGVEQPEDFYARGGFDRVHRRAYAVKHLEARSREHGIYHQVWM